MKSRFWAFLLVLVIGALLAGYSSGHYEGVRSTRIETQQFLREFARSTDLEAYLQQHGQQDWTAKLRVYGIAGASSYVHSRDHSTYTVLVGIACVAVGLVGLFPLLNEAATRRSSRKSPGFAGRWLQV